MNREYLKRLQHLKISEATLYDVAVCFHKTHKNEFLSFKNASYLKQIYADQSRNLYIKKATQSGVSEYLISRAIYRANKGKMLLYVLPTFDLKNQFVKERFDKTILNTNYYRTLISETEIKHNDSMALKQISGGTIAFAGSNSTVPFVSFAADDVIIDELDECNQENLAMAEERQSASKDKTTVKVANPTLPNFGIDFDIKKTDNKFWFIKCPSCGESFTPDYFKHVVREVDTGVFIIRDREYDPESGIDIQPICHKCENPFDRYMIGEWVKSQRHENSGYNISKMFSTTVKLKEIVNRHDEGLSNDTKLQRFYNGDLGMTYSSDGAKITDNLLDNCICDYTMPDSHSGPCILGADVGSKIHIVINHIRPDGIKQVVFIGSVREEEEVIELYNRYNCTFGVIDLLPETRMSKRLMARFRGMCGCLYVDSALRISIDKFKVMHTNRTQALDNLKEKFIKKEVMIPKNSQSIDEFYPHMKANVRVFDEKSQKYKWVENEADHLAHAFSYSLLAENLFNLL